MGLINQHQIGVADFMGAAMDGLDACKQNTGLRLALAQARRINAGRCLRPKPDHLGMVLGDQFAHMGHDQDALIRPSLQHPFDE